MNLNLKNIFKSEDSLFALTTGFKVAGIFVCVLFLVSYIFWIVLALNNVFFESQGFMNGLALREAYYDHVLRSSVDLIPYLSLVVIGLFFSGIYVSKMLMRPFKIIGEYCDAKVEGKNVSYNPDQFSDYKLLTRFSDFFFQYVDDRVTKGSLVSNSIPPQFLGIRKPLFERVFFFHFFLLFLIIALISVIILNISASAIREDIVDLAVQVLNTHGSGTSHFFQEQAYVFQTISVVATLLLFVSYMMLTWHLYGKVSGAVFGFFSTMRSFMKGNFEARVHLLGYNHVRPYGRSLNQYLKHIGANLSGGGEGSETKRNKEKSGNK